MLNIYIIFEYVRMYLILTQNTVKTNPIFSVCPFLACLKTLVFLLLQDHTGFFSYAVFCLNFTDATQTAR